MKWWLSWADRIDAVNERIGRWTAWLALLMVFLGAFNAISRYLGRFIGVNLSSNAYLESQWYLFSLLFLLGAGYTLKHNAHVRVDVLYGRLDRRRQAWIDLVGTAVFLIPFSLLMLWLTLPTVRNSWAVLEVSPDPGGLPRYPIKTAILLAFVLILLQGISIVIRRLAVLRGHADTGDRDPSLPGEGMTDGGVLGPLMFVCALLLIFTGYPVAFALGGAALIFSVIGVQVGYFEWSWLYAMPERVFGIMSNYVLLAVPFFIFMGTMLEKSKLAEDLLRTIGLLFGPLRGGLALAVVFVGALLAAATGVVGASVVAMGLISLPIMLRYGYSKELAAGVITASGTLGQIIPPSVVLVVLADQMGISVGDLFVGSLVPGLMLAGMYALYVVGTAIARPRSAPALPAAERTEQGAALAKRVMLAMVPPLVLIVLVLGSIFAGVATPTEAGALGAVGATLLAGINRRLDRAAIEGTLIETMKLTSMVMFLLIGSTFFSHVFRGLNGDLWIEGLLTNLPGDRVGFLVLANLAIFILGFFIDFFEIAFIIIPLLVPAARLLGIDLVWFGVMIGLNLQTSFLTPPFGFALFYLRGVAPPEMTTGHIYRGAIPFIVIQLIGLAIICFFPEVVTWLIDR